VDNLQPDPYDHFAVRVSGVALLETNMNARRLSGIHPENQRFHPLVFHGNLDINLWNGQGFDTEPLTHWGTALVTFR